MRKGKREKINLLLGNKEVIKKPNRGGNFKKGFKSFQGLGPLLLDNKFFSRPHLFQYFHHYKRSDLFVGSRQILMDSHSWQLLRKGNYLYIFLVMPYLHHHITRDT